MRYTFDIEERIIESFGGTDIIGYTLINNYGYKFKIHEKECSVRHWLNCYGCDVNYWENDLNDNDEIVKQICETLNEYSQGRMSEFTIKLLMEGND